MWAFFAVYCDNRNDINFLSHKKTSDTFEKIISKEILFEI
jgi:hypothetical protein